MSYFDEMEAHGGVDPYIALDEDARRAEEEHFYTCGCGDPTCLCDDRDSSNVNIQGKWYSADCAKADSNLTAEYIRSAKADVERDDFNERRR